MPPTLARDFPPRRRTSIAMLLALLALAAITQAFAPASASALINQGTVSGCIITVNLETEKIEAKTSDGGVCALTEKELIALAEKGGLGSVSVYYPTGTAPEQPAPPVDPCQNPRLCKPPGGRATDTPPDDVLHDKKVPPRGGGSPKGEVKKPPKPPKPKTAAQVRAEKCKPLFDELFRINNHMALLEELVAAALRIDSRYVTFADLEQLGLKKAWEDLNGKLGDTSAKAAKLRCTMLDVPPRTR